MDARAVLKALKEDGTITCHYCQSPTATLLRNRLCVNCYEVHRRVQCIGSDNLFKILVDAGVMDDLVRKL